MTGRFGRGAAWPAALSLVVCALVAGRGLADAAPKPHGELQTARIGLTGADPEGLRQFAAAVSDPTNAEYRHFLSPAEVDKRFGPTAEQVQEVHDWVAKAGLRITGENSHWVDVAGSPQAVAQAFRPGAAGPDARAASSPPRRRWSPTSWWATCPASRGWGRSGMGCGSSRIGSGRCGGPR